MRLPNLLLLILGAGALFETCKASTRTAAPDRRSLQRLGRNFLRLRVVQDGTNSPLLVSTTAKPENVKTVTRAGLLAKSFEPVLPSSDGELFGCIDTANLLHACRNYVSVLKDMGQRQVAYDLEGNLKKIETLYHMAPPERRRTVTELLQYEKTTGIHGPAGNLKDPSGAMGLLWLRRSLSCQERMYSMLIENRCAQEAAVEAYKSELQPYHGWVLQRLALAKPVPSRHDTLSRIGGFENTHFGEDEEEATVNDLRRLCATMSPILNHCKQVYEELDIEDTRRVG